MQPFLTKRDAWAATFEWIFDLIPEIRTDCPTTTPDVPSHRAQFPDTLPLLDGKGVLSDLQIEILAIVAGVTEDREFNKVNISTWNEGQGAKYCKEKMNQYFGRVMV